jgi:hypothetical protein
MTGRPAPTGRLAAFAGAAAVLNLLLVVPYQLMQIDSIIERHSAQLPEPRRPGYNVYFISPSRLFYSADLVQMDPRLMGPDLLLSSRGPKLDAELRRQNWPDAALVGRYFGVEEWHLGPSDERRTPRDSSGTPRFVFSYSDQVPTDGGTRH